MSPEAAKQYLEDVRTEVKAVAVDWSLERFTGGERRIIKNPDWTASFCSVTATRMAIIWSVTNRTAIRRLEALKEHGVTLCIPRRKYGIRRYLLSKDDSLNCVLEAIEHWKSVGYSQTEIRPEIIEGAAA